MVKENMKRVVITGMGVVSPLGCEVETFWKRITAGESGIGPITKFDASAYTSQIAGEVRDFDTDAFIPKKEQKRMDEFTRFAIGAAKMAAADSGLDMSAEDPYRVGVLVGSGVGGIQTLVNQAEVLLNKGPSRCSPFMIPQMIPNMAGGMIAIDLGLKGINYCVVSACASSSHAMGDALRMVQRGDLDIALSGGAEAAVSTLGLAGFCSLRALSTRNDAPQKASRPFDKDRDGFIMADGAGILVLEEYEHAKKRNAKIYCEILGCGMTCDAFHMTAPSETGEGAAKAMELALNDAGVTADKVDYINAHGTSTQLNDKVETMAIKRALGEEKAGKVMISSSKSMTGHLLGAAGAVEAIVCTLALRDGIVPPTINHETPDPDCDLDYVPNESRQANLNYCLNNSLGFGGHNASILFGKV